VVPDLDAPFELPESELGLSASLGVIGGSGRHPWVSGND
jgi:hypothetical protein